MNERRPILVMGGTRGTGLLIVRRLQLRGDAVRVLARDPAHARALFNGSVEVIGGDITKEHTLAPAIEGARHVIFTAGCRSGYPVREPRVKATEYDGVINVLAAAQRSNFGGRFLYMTSSGITMPSAATVCLNLWKGNTLLWRRLAENEIRASGLTYTIIRTGILLNRHGGRHKIEVTQRALPLSLRYRIARADVAEIFLAAVDHPKTARTTFETFWGDRGGSNEWSQLFDKLSPDTRGLSTHS